MSGPTLEAKVKERVDKALEEKELGNAAFKAGEHQQAIKHYYNVILNLKGLATGGSMKPDPVILPPKRAAPSKATITELPENEDSDDETESNAPVDADTAPSHPPSSSELAASSSKENGNENGKPTVDEKYTGSAIKKVMATCYVNMCICHAKKNAWAPCKRNAENALLCEPDNFKAKFRAAQATVRLGEVSKGRTMLLDLQKIQEDPAIANELKVLDAAEAAREKKANASFRGFINKANPPKISEITEEPATPSKVAEESHKAAEAEIDAAPTIEAPEARVSPPLEDA